MQAFHCLVAWLALCAAAMAAPQVPAKPTKYFNDYAGMVSRATAERLNGALEDFERKTSSQILVAIYPKLPANAALEDFTLKAARAWQPGQQGTNNGAVLFIFRDDRKMRIEVGYGLEGAIPDIVAKRIIDNEIAPRFRSGNVDGGVTAGVNALMKAAQGEYRGTGTTVYSRRGRGSGSGIPAIPLFVILLIFVAIAASSIRRRGTMYHRRRRDFWGGWGGWIGGMGTGGGLGGGWKGGGGGGWSAGGGFSGGGGSFGGGGASGGW